MNDGRSQSLTHYDPVIVIRTPTPSPLSGHLSILHQAPDPLNLQILAKFVKAVLSQLLPCHRDIQSGCDLSYLRVDHQIFYDKVRLCRDKVTVTFVIQVVAIVIDGLFQERG